MKALVVTLICAALWLATPAHADVLTAHMLAVGFCFSEVRDLTGLEPWQLQHGGEPEVIKACREAPLRTLQALKGVGNVLIPVSVLRAGAPPVLGRQP